MKSPASAGLFSLTPLRSAPNLPVNVDRCPNAWCVESALSPDQSHNARFVREEDDATVYYLLERVSGMRSPRPRCLRPKEEAGRRRGRGAWCAIEWPRVPPNATLIQDTRSGPIFLIKEGARL